ncbi:MAG TPA: hypothetical protein VHV57_03360 [Acidimicrobiales bacterium]|jgi:hypothetical protein|nr:hypothetical protein [Acidimicrobiales bacterium]
MTDTPNDDTERVDEGPSPEAVATRAGGRPPEEASSDDPEHQAETILEESEERTDHVSEER